VVASQQSIEAKLDAALARLGSVQEGAASTEAFADCKLAPEDPRKFWDDYFGSEKVGAVVASPCQQLVSQGARCHALLSVSLSLSLSVCSLPR
jgi:hypothetical protein